MKFRVLLLSAAVPAVVPHIAFAAESVPVTKPAAAPHAGFIQAGSTADPEIVVSANVLGLLADETATPVITLSGDELIHRRQATLGDTLTGQPGINFDNFGGGASRPVIRGLDGDRVRILGNGGATVDASSLSFDHAGIWPRFCLLCRLPP